MTRIKVRYLVEKPGAGNTVRWFWQPSRTLRALGWRPQRLAQDVADPAEARVVAIRDAERLNAEVDAWRAGRSPGHAPARIAGPATGTIDALVQQYRASDDYRRLAPATRATYEKLLRPISEWAGDAPLRAITPKMIKDFYTEIRARTPAKARMIVAVLRVLYSYAISEDLATVNPAKQVRVHGGRAAAARIWSREDVDALVAAADHLELWSIGTAVRLNEWLGQREGDVLAMRWTAYRDGAIHVVQQKTRARVELPVDTVPELARRLDEEFARQAKRRVASTTIIVSEATGEPYGVRQFYTRFRQVRDIAAERRPEVAGLWFARLRHTAVTRLAEARCPTPLIAAVTGHTVKSVDTIIERYLVRTSAMAREAFQMRLDRETGDRSGC